MNYGIRIYYLFIYLCIAGIVITTSVIFILILNLIYNYNAIVIVSDLTDQDAFGLIISLATLITTILIAIFQLLREKRKNLEIEKENFLERLKSFLDNFVDEATLYNLNNAEANKEFSRLINDPSFDKNNKYSIVLTNKSYLDSQQLKIDKIIILEDYNGQADSTSKSNKEEQTNNIKIVGNKVVFSINENGFIKEAILDFLAFEDKHLYLNLHFCDYKNKFLQANIIILLQIRALHKKSPIYDVDGIGTLEIKNKTLKIDNLVF